MSAPPGKTGIAGTPSNAEAKAAFGQLWDYVVGRLGGDAAAPAPTDAEKAAARAALAVASKIEPISAAVTTGALTLTLNPTALEFRSNALTSGTVNSRSVSSALTLVVPSGATLGSTSAVLSKLMLLAIDNAGTVELAVCNGSLSLDESTLISTTTLDAASDSASVIYSATARTNVPFRIVGYVESTQATAGTWSTAPSKIQGVGGQALQPNVKAALNATGDAPIYACRAWVNFNGTGTVAIRASGNVSSITDNGTGDYTVNFTTAMPDADYGFNLNGTRSTLGVFDSIAYLRETPTTSAIRINTTTGSGAVVDALYATVSIFR